VVGPGDLHERETERLERTMRTCRECADTFCPRGDEEICDDCSDRLHPACACGKSALQVVDVICGGTLVERAPVCSYECARGSVDEAHLPVIDTVIDSTEMAHSAGKDAPCWCHLRDVTVCRWCPAHGEEK